MRSRDHQQVTIAARESIQEHHAATTLGNRRELTATAGKRAHHAPVAVIEQSSTVFGQEREGRLFFDDFHVSRRG